MTLVVVAKQYKDFSLSSMVVRHSWPESLGSKVLCRQAKLVK